MLREAPLTFFVMGAFKALDRDWEIALITSDDDHFARTRTYLAPLIANAAKRVTDPAERHRVLIELDRLVAVAAQRFLANPKNLSENYKFSTYFTWYIAQVVNDVS